MTCFVAFLGRERQLLVFAGEQLLGDEACYRDATFENRIYFHLIDIVCSWVQLRCTLPFANYMEYTRGQPA
jgi:hypothetical protein